jgi:CheY-like chemotaxis protein
VPPVLACEGKLGQVFLNLLLNAAQAIPVGKSDQNRIVISTAAEPGWVVCTVSDTGAGIAPEIIGHIFDPFFTTKEPGEGTGLGLSICHGIVTSLGGTITVESEPGRGARFVVRLPAHGSELPAPRPAVARAPQPTSLPRRRVLVIDDEELIGRSVRRVLEGECDTEVEPSPARALERLRAGERFDLVLCDIMMPRFSGVDFYERVREAVPAALGRIAFITGGAFAPRERQFLESSGVAWLEKPIQFSMLRDLLWGRRA